MPGETNQPMRGRLASVAAPSSPSDQSIRPLRASDESALGRLMAAAYCGSVDDNGESQQWHAAEARATVHDHFGPVQWPACFAAPAAEGDDLRGVSVVTEHRRYPLLAFLLVEPAARGYGLGEALLRLSAHALRGKGHEQWTLAVTIGNPAQRLYERNGFVVDESLRGTRTE